MLSMERETARLLGDYIALLHVMMQNHNFNSASYWFYSFTYIIFKVSLHKEAYNILMNTKYNLSEQSNLSVGSIRAKWQIQRPATLEKQGARLGGGVGSEERKRNSIQFVYKDKVVWFALPKTVCKPKPSHLSKPTLLQILQRSSLVK